ncbi:MAG TPA: flagellar basal body L-ring protein FlgH [Tepidisphaeraceae bacterium]|jgi:flagellar L-ring protein precursor FlgH|nr:flagellar basal body L-ring protein FlgH [Tepidisphaeraceae bacterium]
MNSRTLLHISLICACSATFALAQTAPEPVARQAATAVPADYASSGGNSLLRAGVSLMPPPPPGEPSQKKNAQSRMAAVSLLAVPAPQPRMLKKHDLIQIIIREDTQASSKANTDAEQQTTLDAHLDTYAKLTKAFQLKGVIPTNPLAVAGGTDNHFQGDATAQREDSVVTRIGAEVLDVKPNGTLLIQARKHIKLDEEEQDYILSGVCRVDDVGADNTVLSTQLHDLDFTETTKGIVHDTNSRGFISKLLANFNPF